MSIWFFAIFGAALSIAAMKADVGLQIGVATFCIVAGIAIATEEIKKVIRESKTTL